MRSPESRQMERRNPPNIRELYHEVKLSHEYTRI